MAKPFVNPFVSGQLLELRVDALVSDGRGLGRHDGVVVLVEDALRIKFRTAIQCRLTAKCQQNTNK